MFINTRNAAGSHPAGSRTVNRRRVLQGAALAAAALPLDACGGGGATGKDGEVTYLMVLD